MATVVHVEADDGPKINNVDIEKDENDHLYLNSLPACTTDNGDNKSDYWRRTICIVSLPFTVLGFPPHLIFSKSEAAEEEYNSNLRMKWFRSAFGPPTKQSLLPFLLTVLFLILTAAFLLFVIYGLCSIFYYLVVLGQMTSGLSMGLMNFARIIPGVFPVLYGWGCGHWLQYFNHSFDRTRRELQDEVLNLSAGGRDPTRQQIHDAKYWGKRNARRKLAYIYGTIFVMHATYIVAEYGAGILGSWITYWVEIMNQLVQPVYAAYCWVIISEFDLLFQHLTILQLNATEPTLELFFNIKICYKKILDHVDQVNGIFQMFMSWILIDSLISIITDLTFGSLYLYEMAALKKISFEDFFTESKIEAVESVFTPAVVRCAVAYYFAAFLQIMIFHYTIGQAAKVNKQSRYLNVFLKDYTASVAGQMTPELCRAYRLLTDFMDSANEKTHAAWMKIPLLNWMIK